MAWGGSRSWWGGHCAGGHPGPVAQDWAGQPLPQPPVVHRVVLGRLHGLGTCSSLGGAVPGGCWGPGQPAECQEPAWVQEKRSSGGGTSSTLQHQACPGSHVGPGDSAEASSRPLHHYLAPQNCFQACPALLPLLLLAGRKQLNKSQLGPLTRCCLRCCSLRPRSEPVRRSLWCWELAAGFTSPGPSSTPGQVCSRPWCPPQPPLQREGAGLSLWEWSEGPEGFRC